MVVGLQDLVQSQEQKETGTEHDNDTEAPHAKVSPGEEKKIMLDLWPSGYWHMDYLLNVLLPLVRPTISLQNGDLSTLMSV